jgi:hypothetical protein
MRFFVKREREAPENMPFCRDIAELLRKVPADKRGIAARDFIRILKE